MQVKSAIQRFGLLPQAAASPAAQLVASPVPIIPSPLSSQTNVVSYAPVHRRLFKLVQVNPLAGSIEISASPQSHFSPRDVSTIPSPHLLTCKSQTLPMPFRL